MPELTGGSPAELAAGELDDALYYLRRDCEPCAQRHFDRARAHGATEEQIAAVLATAGRTPGGQPHAQAAAATDGAG